MKDIKYYSTDKLYTVKDNKLKGFWRYILLILSSIMLVLGVYFIMSTSKIGGMKSVVGYTETGKTDYTVYLKDNNYYEDTYLKSGMQYVASLINTVNGKFNYEIHSEENLKFNYTYSIKGTLNIMDKDSSNVLYTKEDVLLSEQTKTANSNNIVINEDTVIDYGKYNAIVNSYKSEYGVSVKANLYVTLSVKAKGESESTSEELETNKQLQIVIPLSEQTIDITINGSDIDNSDNLKAKNGISISNAAEFIIGIGILALSIIGLYYSYVMFKEYNKNNIYEITVNKILREYDRLIVNGHATIKEKNYSNIIYPAKFEEMVDAAENLGAPINYYEVIPGEKCFFVIASGDTLYKYRLTKAFLENNETTEEE